MHLGTHLLMDFFGCDSSKLDDVVYIEDQLMCAANDAGAHLLGAEIHRFSPQGVTGILSLRESHLSIHTWPEHQFAAADFFSCGQINAHAAYKTLLRALSAKDSRIQIHERGSKNGNMCLM